MKESTHLTNKNLCLYFQFQRLIIEEKETEKNAVDTATLMGGPKGKKGGFQLEFVSISRVINHMTCYYSSAFIGGKFIFKKSFTRSALQSECCNFNQ